MSGFTEILRWLLEISMLAVMFFFILRVLRGTRGLFMLATASALIVGLNFLSRLLGLPVLQWIMEKLLSILPMFLIVIFQTEIRRLLTMIQVGNLHSRSRFRRYSDRDHDITALLLGVAGRLSSSHTGALIAIEQHVGLEAWGVSGVRLNAPLRDNSLLETIFYEGSPLHDGGVILRRLEVLSAGCTFPLSERDDGNVTYGMRHKAALGLSEQSDAIVVVVSEETGRISIARDGVLTPMSNLEQFRQTLNNALLPLRERAGGKSARERWARLWGGACFGFRCLCVFIQRGVLRIRRRERS